MARPPGREEGAGDAADDRSVGEVDDVIDVGFVVEAQRVAPSIEQQGDRHGNVEPTRISAAIGQQAPGDGDDQQRAGVPDRPRSNRLAAKPGRVRVNKSIDRESQRRRLRGQYGDRERHLDDRRALDGALALSASGGGGVAGASGGIGTHTVRPIGRSQDPRDGLAVRDRGHDTSGVASRDRA